MEQISPLFAIQAEKALKTNNPQLAIEICKRGIQFFPDYQIGYVLLAEAYEMLGDTNQRDQILEKIHQQFPKAITTKIIEEKIKAEGSLLQNSEETVEIELENVETKNNEDVDDTAVEENEEATIITNKEKYDKDVDWNALANELSVSGETFQLQEEVSEELVNIDELIDEAQSVIQNIEETIEDLEDEIANAEEEYIEELIEADISDEIYEEVIQDYAEMESEIADLQDFANLNENPESIVEFSEELLEIEHENIPFETSDESLLNIDISIFDVNDINLIPGINYLPFQFNYDEIITISKNISLDNYLKNSEDTPQVVSESEMVNKIEDNNIEPLQENEITQDNNLELEEDDNLPDDFIPTETLALIYEKQGKYMNAIDIYQKLMEIHPEKMEHYLNKIMLLETEGN